MEVDTFLLTVYCVMNALYKALVATNPPSQCGRRPEMTDSEVLTLTLLAQWQHNRSERAFLRYARWHWQSYFPRLLSQSAFNRRSWGLWGALCHLGPTGPIAPRLGVGLPGDMYLGDRGFAGAQWQQHWQQAYGAQVLTPRDLPTSRTPWLARLRQVVERVFQVLDALFGVKFPGARTHWGLLTRLAAKIAALNIMVHLNYSENRPALAFMSPFD